MSFMCVKNIILLISVIDSNNGEPHYDYQRRQLTSNESKSLPIAWIAAIVINAILVLLFIVFLIYCYFRSRKKHRQRIHGQNSRPESVLSNVQNFQEVSKVEEVANKETINEKTEVKMISAENTIRSDAIFNIESEHKRITEESNKDTQALQASVSPANDSNLIKTTSNKIRNINRVSNGSKHGGNGRLNDGENAANGYQYNPAESPTASMFSSKLKETTPNSPAKYLSKHDEQQNIATNGRKTSMKSVTEVDGINKMIRDEDLSGKNGRMNQKSDNDVRLDLEQISSIKKSLISSRALPTRTDHYEKREYVEHAKNPTSISPPFSSHNTAVQTSPNTSWLNIRGNENLNIVYDETKYNLKGDTERKYFIYIIKDVNPYTKKECVGRITLPTRQRITLEQLRNYLLQCEDESIRKAAKRKFRFLSESYRLVALNESFTPVDEVYPTQGIFIKFNSPDTLPFGRSRTKSRLSEKTSPQNYSESIYTPVKEHTSFGSNKRFDSTLMPQRTFASPMLSPRTRNTLCPQETTPSPMVSPRTKMRLCQKIQMQSQLERGSSQRNPSLLILSIESLCDNPGCINKPQLKCWICSKVNYCSAICKKQHWTDHRFRCKKPPWK